MSSCRSNSNQFLCHACGKSFITKGSLNKHLLKFHGIDKRKCKFLCMEVDCKQTFTKRNDLIKHLKEIHQFDIITKNMEFNTIEEFYRWKANEEKGSSCCWIKRSKYMTNDSIKMIFVCHRTGTYNSRSSGKRKIKRQGSCKIQGACISAIIVEQINDIFSVSYTTTHYGHSIDIKHLRLTFEQKSNIARQLIEGVTSSAILEKERKNIESNYGRIRLLKRKDIINISKTFNVKTEQRDANTKKDTTNISQTLKAQKDLTDSGIEIFGDNDDNIPVILSTPSDKEKEDIDTIKKSVLEDMQQLFTEIQAENNIDNIRDIQRNIKTILLSRSKRYTVINKITNKKRKIVHRGSSTP